MQSFAAGQHPAALHHHLMQQHALPQLSKPPETVNYAPDQVLRLQSVRCSQFLPTGERMLKFAAPCALLLIKSGNSGSYDAAHDTDIWFYRDPHFVHVADHLRVIGNDSRIAQLWDGACIVGDGSHTKLYSYGKPGVRWLFEFDESYRQDFARMLEFLGVSDDHQTDTSHEADALNGSVANRKKKNQFDERTDEASAAQYFQFYGFLSQQQNMMQDCIRTSTYQRAIVGNTIDFAGKVVLDVGTGSGILAFFAAQAGAARIYAVEASSMADHCRTLTQHNPLTSLNVVVVRGKMEELNLPEKVDVIISEPIGYMLVNERMLETFLHARSKWLKPGGKMFPTQADLFCAPFTDEPLHMEQTSKAAFWCYHSFHGVDLSSLRDEALAEYFKQPVVDSFDQRLLLSAPVKRTFNFLTLKEQDLRKILIPIEFCLQQTAVIHGLAFWFDAAFIGSEQSVILSTAPNQPLTHWYQVRCLFLKPIFGMKGQYLSGAVTLHGNTRQSYEVEFELTNTITNQRTSNIVDLKNPYFRYTGITCNEFLPGFNIGQASPTDYYWQQYYMSTQQQQQSQLPLMQQPVQQPVYQQQSATTTFGAGSGSASTNSAATAFSSLSACPPIAPGSNYLASAPTSALLLAAAAAAAAAAGTASTSTSNSATQNADDEMLLSDENMNMLLNDGMGMSGGVGVQHNESSLNSYEAGGTTPSRVMLHENDDDEHSGEADGSNNADENTTPHAH